MSRIGQLGFLICVIAIVISMSAYAQKMAESEENKSAVSRFLDEAYSKGNLAVGDEYLAANVVLHATSGDLEGIEGWKQYATMFLTAFPDLHLTVEDAIAEENKVVIRWMAKGTHKGNLRDIPPTGKQVTLTGIAIYRFAGGKMEELWGLNDAMGMMQQLGIAPADRENYSWGKPSEVTGTSGDPEENKAVVRRFLEEVVNKGDQAVADELVAAEFVDHNPLPGLTPNSEGFKQSFVIFRSAFPDLEYTIEDMIAEGDKVAARWTAKGTHKGELAGIAPTNKNVVVTGIDIFRVADSQLMELWLSWDQMGMMQQLGVIPPPDQPGG